MPNDMPINIGLNAAEFRLVQVMRRFLLAPHEENHDSVYGPMLARATPHLQQFLDRLWNTDPFIVELNHPHDGRTTVFELQFLYAIAEMRAGHDRPVDELIAWWFPENLAIEVRHDFESLVRTLEDAGMPPQSGERLSRQILAITTSRVRDRESRSSQPHSAPESGKSRKRPVLIH